MTIIIILSQNNNERSNHNDQGLSREWCQTDLTISMKKEFTPHKKYNRPGHSLINMNLSQKENILITKNKIRLFEIYYNNFLGQELKK